jgi:hypothetical protein
MNTQQIPSPTITIVSTTASGQIEWITTTVTMNNQ